MLLKLAQDVEFLRKYIVHPNKDLELRLRELEKINRKLREIVKILAEDRIIIKKELTDKTQKLGGYSEKINLLRDKLLRREDMLARLSQQVKDQKELIVSLRNEKIGLEVGEKEKNEAIGRMGKRILSETDEKRTAINKMTEAKKILEKQISAIKREKDRELLNKKELQDKLAKLVPVIEKQNKLLENAKIEFYERMAVQKKHYEKLMAELNQAHVKEMIDKKALILSMKKRIDQLNELLEKKKQREHELVEKFTEKLKEIIKE